MKKILITGGSGFLGRNLISRLIKNKKNHNFCLDNFYTSSKANIYEFLNYKNFDFILHDVNLPIHLEVDEIYHLACPASPIHYQRDPVQTLKTCVNGTINVLGLAKKLKCKVLHASTSEVYGNPLVHPQKEEYWGNVNPIGIRACYDEGKRAAETICFDYIRRDNVDIRVPRIFNTYGPYMDENDGRVVSNFIVQAINDKDISIYGDGKQTRSFCYVDDLIDGFIKIMKSKNLKQPINLGNPKEKTISQIADLVIKMSNSKSKKKYFKLPQDDPTRRKPDISLIKQKLNWSPKIELSDGLSNTIKYFQSLK